MKKQLLCAAFAIVLSVGLFQGVMARSDSPELSPPDTQTECNEMEVVFVIDQSGSMGGSYGHPDPNDPLGLRFFGPIFAARWMANYYLSTSGSPIPGRPPITFHMAVVSFGDEALVTLPWQTIAPNDQLSWTKLRKTLDQKLGEDGLQGRSDLGNTNFVDAFQKASDLFALRDRPQGGCPRRAILLLTDGQPQLARTFTIPGHMAEVKDIFQKDFPPSEYTFYVTAMNDYAADNYWVTMEPYWKDILSNYASTSVPGAVKVNSHDEIGDRFNAILYELTNQEPPEPVSLGKHTVPPYLQAIIFTLYKQSESEHLILQDEYGNLDKSRQDVLVEVTGYDEPIESWTITRPLPGQWTIGTTANRGDLLITEDRIPAAVWLRSPSGSALQFVQSSLEFQLVESDQNHTPLPEYADPQYRLSVTATVSTAEREWPLNLASNTLLTQTYTAPFLPVEAGAHQLRVGAVASDDDNQLVTVINGAVGQFVVDPVSLHALELKSSNTCPVQQGDSLQIAYQTVAPGNHGVQISVKPEWDLVLETGTQAFPVAPQGPDENGIYSALLPLPVAGDYHLSGVVKVVEPVGAVEQTLFEEDRKFTVVSSQPLAIQIIKPLSGTMVGRTCLWQPASIDLEVWFSGPDGTEPWDPENYLQPPVSDPPVELIISPLDEQIALKTVMLEPTVDKGRYTAHIEGLPLGEYDLIVRLISGQIARCGWRLPVEGRIRIRLVENPWIIAEIVGMILVAIYLIWMLIRAILVRQHPCRGWVNILRSDGTEIHSSSLSLPIDLDKWSRCHVVLKKRDLGETGYDRLELRCPNADYSEKYKLEVTVFYRNEKNKRDRFGPITVVADSERELPMRFKFKYAKKGIDV